MVVTGGIANSKTYDHFSEKRRRVGCLAAGAMVFAGVEDEFVNAHNQIVSGEQGLVRASIRVGHVTLQQSAFVAMGQKKEAYLDARGRFAASRVEHVR